MTIPILASLLIVAHIAQATPPYTVPLTLAPTDRVLVLAPHPDDEVIGCAGIIQQAKAMNLPIRVAYLTYGDNNQWSFMVYRKRAVLSPASVRSMGLVRHDEAVAAASRMGLTPNQLTFLGYPDFGTLQIWINHWGSQPPYEGMLTRAMAVPYPNALHPGAPFKGEAILKDLTTLIRDFKPTKVFTSHPADFNVDHRALYCVTRLALWELEWELKPAIFPYLVHFPRWPVPRGSKPGSPLSPPGFFTDDIAWTVFGLSDDAVSRKADALRAHVSQFEVSGHYLRSFVRTNELFGDFETIVLHRPATTSAPAMAAPEPGPPRHGGGTSRPFMTGIHHYEGDEEGHLTESERNGFVGLEWRHVQLETNAFTVSIDLSRPLAGAVKTSIQVFGYRRDTPFESMPKIRVEIGALGHAVHDQLKLLPDKAVRVTRNLKEMGAEIPLDTLGNPERAFVCARTYLGDIPLDWVSWRVVEFQ